jgi:hypothetical protein
MADDPGFPLSPVPGDKPLWAKCEACGHRWPVAYYPMSMALLAKVIQDPHCPRCGESGQRVVVARQHNGVLLEPGGSP